MFSDPDVIKALKDDPSGAICAHCGAPNDWADDCGWFYTEGKYPTCADCSAGIPGKAHEEYYGVGER